MKKHYFWMSWIVLMTIILSVNPVFAQKGHMGGGGMGGWFNDRLLKDVGVSDPVRTQIRDIALQARKDMMDNQSQIREKRLALQKEYFKANLEESVIETLNQEIWELQKKQFQRIEKAKLSIAKLLTGEQREKLSKLIFERKKEFWGGMRYMDN